MEALKSGCEVTPPSPVVWSYPRLGASGPVLDLSEHLTLLTHILAMVPKSISYIDLSPFILSSGSKTPRSVWRVVAQPEEAAHNFEVEMLSQEAADSARKQAGFVDAIYWEKDFCEVEV